MFSGEIGSFLAANIVRSCPDDWKQQDGAALARITHRSKHNLAQRADRLFGHGDAPVLSEGRKLLISKQNPPTAIS
jgi:hypothetical protein